MFSLIITIIAIALVAALALATIYYGGSAFNRSSASANAAKLMNQSQQILGADRLYRVDHEGAMPPSMQALVDGGYLRTIPVAQINGQFDAVAASSAWSMVVSPAGRAYTFSSGDVDVDSCKAVNQMAFGQDGIPNKVFTGFKTQCYGADSTHLAIVVVADPDALGANGSTNSDLPNTPVIKAGASPATGDWTQAPSTSSGDSGGGSSGGGSSSALNVYFVSADDAGSLISAPSTDYADMYVTMVQDYHPTAESCMNTPVWNSSYPASVTVTANTGDVLNITSVTGSIGSDPLVTFVNEGWGTESKFVDVYPQNGTLVGTVSVTIQYTVNGGATQSVTKQFHQRAVRVGSWCS